MRKAVALPGATTLLLLLGVAQLSAQQWNVDAQAGRLRSALDPNAAQSQLVLLGLRYDDERTGFRITGGVPTSSDDALWGSVAAARRLVAQRAGFVAGVDVAANAFVLHDRAPRARTVSGLFGRTVDQSTSLSGGALAGQVLPVIGFEGTAMQVHARAGVSEYSGDFGGQHRERHVTLADVEAAFSPTAALALIPAVRHYRASEGNYTYAGASAILSHGPLSAWASAGQWLNAANESTPWSAGASLRVLERATLSASVRRDAVDPLYLSVPQTAWTAGASILLGKAQRRAAPVPALYENGRASIRLPAAQARTQPSIAGDFTGWKPAPMQRVGNEWVYTTSLAHGVYNFAFVDASGAWFVPENYPGRKDDGMGGHVAVLVVQ